MGAIRHVACRDLATGERRLVLAATDAGGRAVRAREWLDTVADMHSRLVHPHIAPLAVRGESEGIGFVALRSEAIGDFEPILRVIHATGTRLSPPAAVAFVLAIIDTFRTAHRTADREGRPICIGSVSSASFVVCETGHFEIIGWGYPWSEAERRVLLAGAPETFAAWESSFEVPPSPAGDLDAVGRFLHFVLGAAEWPPELFEALRGDTDRQAKLIAEIASLEHVAHARDPAKRSWDEYLAIGLRVTSLLRVTADPAAVPRELATLVSAWRAAGGVRIARTGAWFQASTQARVDLGHRTALRGVLAALVARHVDAPGEAVDPDLLLAAGWPDDQVDARSARNRVRVAIATLRSLGLRDALLSSDDGYQLDARVAIKVE